MGMGCPFHCSGDRATSTLPTTTDMPEPSPSHQKITAKTHPQYSLSEENPNDIEFEEEHLSLKTLATAVKVLTSPPVSEFTTAIYILIFLMEILKL